MDYVLFDSIPSDVALNQTNWLLYNADAPTDQVVPTLDIVDGVPAFDDFTLVPYDHLELLPDPDHIIQLDVVMQELENGLPYAFLNNITYTAPKVPSLYTVLNAGELSTTATIYGEYTNPQILKHMDVIQVVLNNNDTGTHPFHLHGHNFQVISRTPTIGDDFYTYQTLSEPAPFNPDNHTAFPTYPMRRDVVVLPPQGSVVLRFVADNPGVWFFHCHIDWHLSQGLATTFIEAPLEMQQRLTIPADHIAACRAANVAYTGNAAADTEDYLDLSGQPKQAPWIPYGGFTTKGIVAMVFSVLSAVVGITTIAVYGMSEIKTYPAETVPIGTFHLPCTSTSGIQIHPIAVSVPGKIISRAILVYRLDILEISVHRGFTRRPITPSFYFTILSIIVP